MNFGQLITAQTVTLMSLLLPSNHRKGRSAPKPRKPWSPSTCPTVNVWVSASTGPTTAACVRTDGAARHAAHALYPWPLSARTASVSRGRPCSFSHVNAAMTAATSMKWLSLHSTGCTEIHTSSQTSTEDDDFYFYFNTMGSTFLMEEVASRLGATVLIRLQVSEDHRHLPGCRSAGRQGRLGSQP